MSNLHLPSNKDEDATRLVLLLSCQTSFLSEGGVVVGFTKDRYMKMHASGYRSLGDKYVCSRCFDDYAIRDFAKSIADERKCDYCGRHARKPIAASIGEVLRFIAQGIRAEWGDPNNEGVGWEGGWQGAEVIDSDELIRYRIEELWETNETIMDDLVEAFSDYQWCQRNPYGLLPDQALVLSWDQFSEQVKHRTRYVFFRLQREDNQFGIDDTVAPALMLDKLSQVISSLNLVDTIVPDQLLCRVRGHDAHTHYCTAKDLGPPPPEKAIASRMSPAGIPMFYGAYDEKTALAETKPFKRAYTCATVGIFKPLHDIRVLNLTKLTPVPSLFDEGKRHLRPQLIFMKSFIEDLRKPIKKDSRVHIEYVPTQVFTEYIRYLYTDDEGLPVQGIVYPSARVKGGVSVVLFYENEDCCDISDPDGGGKHLQLVAVRRMETS